MAHLLSVIVPQPWGNEDSCRHIEFAVKRDNSSDDQVLAVGLYEPRQWGGRGVAVKIKALFKGFRK